MFQSNNNLPKALNVERLERKFGSLTRARESIQGLSAWIIKYKVFYQQIVDAWFHALSSRDYDALNMFYVANDVIQNCARKKAPEYRPAFAAVLEKAISMEKVKNIKNEVMRMVTLWQDREIFEDSFFKRLEDKLNSVETPDSDIDEDEINEAEVISNFKLENLINSLQKLKTLGDELSVKQAFLEDIDEPVITNYENIIVKVESKMEIRKFDHYQKLVEECLSLSDKVLAAEKLVLLDLQYSSIFYNAQNEDAKKVAHAYRIYGKKVKMVEKAVLEKILNFPEPSPIFSPQESIPSPNFDSENSQKSFLSSCSKTKNSIEGSSTNVNVRLENDENVFIEPLIEKTEISTNDSLNLTNTCLETKDTKPIKKVQVDESATKVSVCLEHARKGSKSPMNFSSKNIHSTVADTPNSFIPLIDNSSYNTKSGCLKPEEKLIIETLPLEENCTTQTEAVKHTAKEHPAKLPDATKSTDKKDKIKVIKAKSPFDDKSAAKEDSGVKATKSSPELPDTFIKGITPAHKNLKEENLFISVAPPEDKCPAKTESDIHSTKTHLLESSDMTVKNIKSSDNKTPCEEKLTENIASIGGTETQSFVPFTKEHPPMLTDVSAKSVSNQAEKVTIASDVQDDIDFLLEKAYDTKVKSKTNFKRKIDNLLKSKQSKTCKLSDDADGKTSEESTKVSSMCDTEKSSNNKCIPVSEYDLSTKVVKLMEVDDMKSTSITSESSPAEFIPHKTESMMSDKTIDSGNTHNVSDVKKELPTETVAASLEKVQDGASGSKAESTSTFIPFEFKAFSEINTELLQSILNRHKDNMNLTTSMTFASLGTETVNSVPEVIEPSLSSCHDEDEISEIHVKSTETSTSLHTEQVIAKDITSESNICLKDFTDLEDVNDNIQQKKTSDVADTVSSLPPNFSQCIQNLLNCLTTKTLSARDSYSVKHSSSIPLENTLKLYNYLVQSYGKDYFLKEQLLYLDSFQHKVTPDVDSVQSNSNVQDATKTCVVKENLTLNDNLEVMDMDVDSGDENNT